MAENDPKDGRNAQGNAAPNDNEQKPPASLLPGRAVAEGLPLVHPVVQEPGTAPPVLTPKQQRILDESRDAWLVLLATAFGYRKNVRWLELLQLILDLLSVLVAVWLVVVLWGVKEMIPEGEYQKSLVTLINVAGTITSITVVSLMLISWRAEWRGKIERHRELAERAHNLAARFYDIFQEDEIDPGRFQRANIDFRAFVKDESEPLGGLPKWCHPKGFQHVGKTYPVQNIRCNSCARRWNELSARRREWRNWLPFGKCENCGVCL